MNGGQQRKSNNSARFEIANQAFLDSWSWLSTDNEP
jgi:hypothetical protein